MNPATTRIVCMTTLTAKARRKFASEFTFAVYTIPPIFFQTDLKKLKLILLFVSSPVPYMKPTVSTTMLMDVVTRAATQRSVAGMA